MFTVQSWELTLAALVLAVLLGVAVWFAFRRRRNEAEAADAVLADITAARTALEEARVDLANEINRVSELVSARALASIRGQLRITEAEARAAADTSRDATHAAQVLSGIQGVAAVVYTFLGVVLGVGGGFFGAWVLGGGQFSWSYWKAFARGVDVVVFTLGVVFVVAMGVIWWSDSKGAPAVHPRKWYAKRAVAAAALCAVSVVAGVWYLS